MVGPDFSSNPIRADVIYKYAEQIQKISSEEILQKAQKYKAIKNAFSEADTLAREAYEKFKKTMDETITDPQDKKTLQIVLRLKERHCQVDLKDTLYEILKPKEIKERNKSSFWKKI